MDNGGYIQDPEKGTELKLVDASSNRSSDYGQKERHAPGAAESASQVGTTPSARSSRSSPRGTRRSSTIEAGSVVGSAGGGTAAGGSTGSGGSGQPPEDPGPSTSCRPEVCQRARERYTAPDLRGSPWHRSKTIFLLSTIGALIVWAIVYGTLSKLEVL